MALADTTTIAESQAAVTTSAASAVSAKANRTWLRVSNIGSTDCYWGAKSTLTTSNGDVLKAGSSLIFEPLANGLCEWTGAFYAVTASGSTTLAIKEVG